MEIKLMIVFECIKSVIENENKKYNIDEESLRIEITLFISFYG